MNESPMKSASSSSQAVEKLRSLIFTGKLGAGSDHLESELAGVLGMSRTPVREALLVLEGQGLVDVRPRKGVRIKPLSPADMAEIYDVLTELESLAARNAANAHYTQGELALLSSCIDEMDRTLRAEDREGWAKADDEFHAELVRLGNNSRVSAIVSMMSDQVRRARLVTLHMRPLPTRSNADHRKLYEALRTGDADAAHRMHHAHRTETKDVLIELLRKHHLNSV